MIEKVTQKSVINVLKSSIESVFINYHIDLLAYTRRVEGDIFHIRSCVHFGAFIFIILGEDGIAKWAKENGDDNDKTEDKIEESDKYTKLHESDDDSKPKHTPCDDSNNYIEKF